MGFGNGSLGGPAQYAGSTTAVQRQPVVSEQMNQLDRHIEQAYGLVGELEARISGVLQPEPPSTNKAESGPGHSGVPLGASLGQMNDRLQMLANRLRNVIERVEL